MSPALFQENPAFTGSSEAVVAEFRALASGCGFYAQNSLGRLLITGEDRVRWLNGMVTNNVRDLHPGRGVYAFLLTPQGRILGDMHIFNTGEALEVEANKAQIGQIAETFNRYIIMDDVEIGEATGNATTIFLVGPKSQAMLEACGLRISELEPLESATIDSNENQFVVTRGDNPAVDSYQVRAASENLAGLTEKLQQAGATAVNDQALEWLRIASGVPLYGVDIRERDLPQETNQDRALNFSKGCYVGQEIVERIRSRGAVHRQFTGFTFEGSLPKPGTELIVDGKKIGEITSAAEIPYNDGMRHVGLGYIRREAASKPYSGDGFTASVTSLPFREFFHS